MTKFLYRGINKEEKEAGCVIIPKNQESFKAHPRLPLPSCFQLGEHTKHAIRDHQNKKDLKIETSGISTTTSFAVAKKYAREGVVVKIDRKALEDYGIKEYVAEEDGFMPINPEDNEVILVNEEMEIFPKEIITDVIQV